MVVPVDPQNGVRQYVWDNITTEFAYPYILEGDSLSATLYNDNGEVVLEIPDTAYTLSAEFSSGVLTITDGGVLVTDADKIILERIEDLSQELDLGKRDFPPEEIERTFDKGRIIDQQQQALTNRGVITNIVENRQEPIELPVAVENLFLAWDDEGNLKNATSTGTALPTVPNTYLRRNNDNTAFSSLTPSEVLTDIGAIDSTDPDYSLPTITADTYLKANAGATAYESKTVSEVETDLGVDILKDQVITGILHVRDEKATTVTGGTSVVGVQTRTLNTAKTNTITGASLSTNQVTLPAGTYKISGKAPAVGSNRSRSYLYNVTDETYDVLGINTNAQSAVGDSDITELRGIITIAGTKVFELRQYIEIALASVGLGFSSNDGRTEVYSELFIEKIGG